MKVLIAAGGTGGHIYPIIAVARELLDKNWETSILFVTTKKGCGVEILKREEFDYRTITVGGLKRKSLTETLLSLIKLPVGLIQAIFRVMFFRPNVVIGAGGYVSGPVLGAAWLMGIPCVIQEQNILPGITNRLLSKIAKKIAVAFPDSLKYFPKEKTVITGNPVRKEFFEIKTRIKEVGKEDLFTVLIFGGSQGARAINMAMVEAGSILSDRSPGPFRILHQTGEADFHWVKEKYQELGINAEVRPFIYDMFDAFRLADLLVCRSGAMTLSEIAAAGKPALLVPLPTAADNHQELNARAMEKENAAEVIIEDQDLAERLAEKIQYYMDNPLALLVVGKEAKQFAGSDAASKIALILEELATS